MRYRIAHLSVSSPAWAEFHATSPIALLSQQHCVQQTICGDHGARQLRDSKSKVVKVLDGDPADKAGVKVGDVITRIDSRALSGC